MLTRYSVANLWTNEVTQEKVNLALGASSIPTAYNQQSTTVTNHSMTGQIPNLTSQGGPDPDQAISPRASSISFPLHLTNEPLTDLLCVLSSLTDEHSNTHTLANYTCQNAYPAAGPGFSGRSGLCGAGWDTRPPPAAAAARRRSPAVSGLQISPRRPTRQGITARASQINTLQIDQLVLVNPGAGPASAARVQIIPLIRHMQSYGPPG